jgi:hypothetical protein
MLLQAQQETATTSASIQTAALRGEHGCLSMTFRTFLRNDYPKCSSQRDHIHP